MISEAVIAVETKPQTQIEQQKSKILELRNSLTNLMAIQYERGSAVMQVRAQIQKPGPDTTPEQMMSLQSRDAALRQLILLGEEQARRLERAIDEAGKELNTLIERREVMIENVPKVENELHDSRVRIADLEHSLVMAHREVAENEQRIATLKSFIADIGGPVAA